MKETPNKALRRKIIELINRGSSPHVGTALSMVEILNSIFNAMDLQKIKSRSPNRDRFVMSKGHGAAALYAVMNSHGLLPDKILETFHTNGSLLAGHASHFVKYVEHSTGALGHGLSVGLGMAIGLRSRDKDSRVFVLVGDGELNEGSNWEALMLAGQLGLRHLYVLVDQNGFDQMGRVSDCCSIDPLKEKFESFNFDTLTVDGHDESALARVLRPRKNAKKPLAIICATTKGKGVSFMESQTVWHYRTPVGDDYAKALAELQD